MTEKVYLTPDWPAPRSIRAYVTTRLGGISAPPYDSFNLSPHVGDSWDDVKTNEAALVDDLELPEKPRWLNQIHGRQVVFLEGVSGKMTGDASITRQENTVCALLTADCLPILLTDRQGTEIAAVHAGWKGLLLNVIEATVPTMRALPSDLLAWMGPAISQAHLELGDDIYTDFLNANADYSVCFKPSSRRSTVYLDLYALARMQCQSLGIHAIYGGDFCTFKDVGRFFSYRRDQGVTGRMASLIFISPS